MAASSASAADGAATNVISASTVQLLKDMDTDEHEPVGPNKIPKRSADDAGLPPDQQKGGDSEDTTMDTEASVEEPATQLMVAMIRVDKEHVDGDLMVEPHIAAVQKSIQSTHACLAKSNSLVSPTSSKLVREARAVVKRTRKPTGPWETPSPTELPCPNGASLLRQHHRRW